MARRNEMFALLVVIAIIVVIALVSIWGGNKGSAQESYAGADSVREERVEISQAPSDEAGSDIEFVPAADGIEEVVDPLGDDFELVGVPPADPAFQIGFGMGPGLYGSGRHTSEMIGN